MLYDRYTRWVTKLAKAMGFIKRHKIALIIAMSVVLACSVTLTGIKGVVVDKDDFAVEIIYGEEVGYVADAIFDDVRYEYQAENSEEWTEIMPRTAGNYLVRAVSVNAVGKASYGKAHSFSILPKKVDVLINEDTVMYGGLLSVNAALVYGDTVSCPEYVYDDLSKETTGAAAVAEAVVILDKNGADVTSSYEINAVKKDVTFIDRPISVTVEGAEGIYDGQKLTAAGYELSDGDLVAGDTLVVALDKFLLNAGETLNTPKISVITANGVNVTERYDITQLVGKLTLEKRTIKVDIYDGTFVYDGQSHGKTDFDVDEQTPLVDGHVLSVVSNTTIINAGSADNLVAFKVTDAEGTDVTENYSVIVSEGKTLTVSKREVTVETSADKWTYNGSSHSNVNFSVVSEQGLAEGHSAEVDTYTEITNAGHTDNALTLVVYDAEGTDVTENYSLVFECGTLEIEKLPITAETSSNSWVYNGKANFDGSHEIISQTQLIEGHSSKAAKNTKITTVGTLTNVLELKITDADNNDVTDNYAISYVNGTLEITPRPITVESADNSWVYDGETHFEKRFKVTSETQIADDQVARVVNSRGIRTVGTVTNEFSIAIDSGNTDVTSNYSITYVDGTLEITQRPITVLTVAKKWIYDGQEHFEEGFEITSELQLVEGHEATVVSNTIVKTVCNVDNVLEIDIYEDETKMTANYDISYEYGLLEVAKRPITVRANDNTFEYDGTVHTEHRFSITSTLDIVEGQTTVVLTDSQIENVGTAENIIEIEIYEEETETTANYDITYVNGTLTVTPRPITVTTDDNSWMYDGTTHYESGHSVTSEKGLVNSHITEVETYTGITDVGTKDNSLTVRVVLGEENMTYNYNITYVDGTLEITKRPMTLTASDAEKIYDGTPLTTNRCMVTSEIGIVTGHLIDCVMTEESTVTDVGSATNAIDVELTTIRAGSVDVTKNYKIDTIDGLLTVNLRPITVTTYNNSWMYDGNAHFEEGCTAGINDLVLDHTLKTLTHTEITNVGTVDNVLTVAVISGETDKTDNYEISYINGTLTITRRPITVTAGDASMVYTGTPLTCDLFEVTSDIKLVEGHVLTAQTVGSQTNAGSSTNSIDPDSVVISDADDADVTYNYAVSYRNGTLTVTKRHITVTSDDSTKEYDGTPLECNTYVITSNEDDNIAVVDGQSASVTIDASIENVGTCENVVTGVTIKITETDEDTTANYDITYVNGTLTVTPRPITITTVSNSWVYDGTSHSDAGHSVTSVKGLVNSHSTESITHSSITDVGTMDNVQTVRVILGETDMTYNYSITYDYGTLEITKRPITVTTASHSWVYDGATHYDGGASVTEGTLVDGHELSTSAHTGIINVGTKDNALTIKVISGSTDKTNNYDISYVNGTLEITHRPVTITAGSGEKVYDDTPLTVGTSTSVNLVRGHTYTLTMTAESTITNVGTVDNLIDEDTIKIYDGTTEVTTNYEITLQKGTLTITPRPITITAGSDEKVYDGTPLTSGLYEITSDIGLVDGHTLSCTMTAESTITNVGTVDNVIDETTVAIFKNDFTDVTSNYAISYVDGTLEVTPRPITLQSGSAERVYNSTPLINHDDIVITVGTLADGQSLTAEATGTITDVGEVKNTIVASISLTSDASVDVTANYNITLDEGTLKVTPVIITYSTETAEKTFDGTPLTRPTIDYACDDLVAGQNITISSTSTITFKGEISNNDVMLTVKDDDDNDYTNNYTLKEGVIGTLTIVPVYLTVATNYNTWVYDGASHYEDGYSLTGSLVEGHSITVDAHTIVEAVCTDVENVLTVNVNNGLSEDMTKGYEISYEYGKLSVTPRPITVKANDETFEYDGEVHTGEAYTITSELAIVTGHVAKIAPITSIENVGTEANQLTMDIFAADEITDVTSNYAITYEDGTLEVTPRPITVAAGSKTKEYDGTPLTFGELTVVSAKTTVKDHIVTAQTVGSQTEIGSSENVITDGTIKVTSGETDVTDNYSISCVNGVLTVTKIKLAYYTESAEKAYDGQPLTKPDVRYVLGYDLGHTITIFSTTSITDVGKVENKDIVCTVTDGEGNNVLDTYYEVSGEHGWLTITAVSPDETVERTTGGLLDDSGNIGGNSGTQDPGPDKIRTVAVKVYSDVSGGIYLRYMSFGDYTGNSWSSAADYDKYISDEYAMSYLAALAMQNVGFTLHTAAITSYSNYLIPYYANIDFGNYTKQFSDVKNTGNIDTPYTVGYLSLSALDEIATLYEHIGDYAVYESDYRAYVHSVYKQTLPATDAYLQEVIADNGLDGFTTTAEIVSAVVEYIRGAATYNLYYDSALDSEEDIVTAFLSNYKSGICQHFAAAATMMFRSLGIPARTVIGYFGNTKAGETVEITTQNAHAWTEVYFDGLGWIQVDATAAGGTDGIAYNGSAGSDSGSGSGGGSGSGVFSGGGSGSGQGSGGSSGGSASDVTEFTIWPVSFDKEYDGTPLEADNQIYGDDNFGMLLDAGYTYSVEVSGSQTEKGAGESIIEDFKLYDPNGNDVTGTYNITKEKGELLVTNPQVIITVEGAEKVYDGTPLGFAGYTVTGLPDGYTLDFDLSTQTIINVGSYWPDEIKNNTEIIILDDSNNDVTDQYYIETVGTPLIITPRPITVAGGSSEKDYDGEPLIDGTVEVISDLGLADGHTISAETTGSQTDVGSSANPVDEGSVIISDEQGTDVTGNYELTIEDGTLTVVDKKHIDNSGNIGGDVLEGGEGEETILAEVLSDYTGTIYLRFYSYGDYIGTGYDVSKNYEYSGRIGGTHSLNYLPAILMNSAGFTMHNATITSYTDYLLPYFTDATTGTHVVQTSDVLYDGDTSAAYTLGYYNLGSLADFNRLKSAIGYYAAEEAAYRTYVYDTYLQIPASTFDYLYSIITQQGLNDYDTIEQKVNAVTEYIKSAAEYNLEYDNTLDTQPDIVVAFLDTYKSGICQHFAAAATMTFRAMGIPARTVLGVTGRTTANELISITARNAHAWTEVYIDGIGWIPVDATAAGGSDNPGGESGVPGTGEGEGESGGGESGGEDTPITAFTIHPINLDKGYDGTPLYADPTMVLGDDNFNTLLSRGFTYEAIVEGSQTDYGVGESTITSFKLYNSNGHNVTDNYTINKIAGKLEITKQQIIVHLYENSKVYDGLPLEYYEDDYYIENLPEDCSVIFALSGIDMVDVGVYDNELLRELPITVYNEIGDDVTDNYHIKFLGALEIKLREITVTSETAEKKYNGTPLIGEEVTVTENSLADGHRMVATTGNSITDPGIKDNTIYNVVIYDENDNDVTENYKIAMIFGKLTVTE